MPAMTMFKQLNLVSTLAFGSLLTDEPLSLLACYWENIQHVCYRYQNIPAATLAILPCGKTGIVG